MAKPFVKWAGGKARLVRELLSRIPGDVRTYAEPFAGGGALFFALEDSVSRGQRTVGRVVLGDRNDELMATYRALKKDVDAVIRALSKYRYDRDMFYDVRARDVRGQSDVARAARFVFLNRTCFNGLWRVNADGKFNVPFGRYKNPRIVDEPNLRACAAALANVDLVTDDYQATTRKLGAGDFVYFDPPYMPLTKTSAFTDYVPGGFSYREHERLADELRSLRNRGCLAMLSNADTASTRALFSDFAVHRVFAPRSINSDGEKRGDASELLVTTWGQPGFIDADPDARAEEAARIVVPAVIAPAVRPVKTKVAPKPLARARFAPTRMRARPVDEEAP